MSKRKNAESASITTRAGIARMANQPEGPNGPQSPKMINLKAMLASGQLIVGDPLFEDSDLRPHGNVIEKGIHAVGVPLSRWRLIASAHCIKGEVHKSDGGAAAHDSDTNFELVIPKFDATGELSDEVKAINDRIDQVNQAESKTFIHIEDSTQNNLGGDPERIGIHCEVDKNRLGVLKPDLAGMMVGDCYEICGQLVIDTWHGILFEIHPVQTVDKC